MSDRPYLAPFSNDGAIILRPMPNGGWVVEQPGMPGEMARPLGAFGNGAHMITALNKALNGYTHENYKGSKEKYDWASCLRFAEERLQSGNMPERQEDFISEILIWFQEIGGPAPDHSTVRRRISPLWRQYHQESK